jgi:hypothetical protein
MNFILVEFRNRRAWVLLVLLLFFGMAGTASAEEAGGVTADMRPAVIAPDIPDEAPVRNDLDVYGGWMGLTGRKTGFFHVEELGGRTWLITPEGHAYFMLEMGWAKKADVPRLKSWGFNSSEPDTGMPYAIDVKFFRPNKRPFPIVHRAAYPPWVTFPDVFDPEWPRQCQELAQQVLGPRAQDPLMIGYFLDNEVCFEGWYDAVLHAPKDAPCRAAFVEVARSYYAAKPGDLARDWKAFNVSKVEDLLNLEGAPPDIPNLAAAWEAAVAERAFSVPVSAAKAVAPNHLCLGARLINAPLPAPGILAAMGKYCDVISMNLYSMLPDRLPAQLFTLVPALHAMTGRPTLTSEFSFRGGDTQHPNTMGALPTVKTQAERAIGYLSYVAAMASIPSHVGVSWYKYPDDDPKASWKGYAEDCNFGVVDRDNRPYAVLSQGMRATNAAIYELAADPVRSESCPLFWRTELMRWDRPGDEILFQRLMGADKPFVDPLAQALPEPRRYHANYWIRHRGPSLTVNDDRFVGWCQANLIKRGDDGTTLVLFNVQALTWFPRSLWLGSHCNDPDALMTLESNAQYLLRRIDSTGRLLRLTLADGSYVRVENGKTELRVDGRVPYLDLRFNPEARELAITTRGSVNQLGVSEVKGWRAVWNGVQLTETRVAESEGLTAFTWPQ